MEMSIMVVTNENHSRSCVILDIIFMCRVVLSQLFVQHTSLKSHFL